MNPPARDARIGWSIRPLLFKSVALSLFLVTALVAASEGRNAGAAVCRDLHPEVRVAAEAPADVAAACRGAARALAFLAAHDITASRPIRIQVVDAIDYLNGAPVAGIYDRRAQVVKVLARSAFAASSVGATVFSVGLNDDLYASVFAHEVAHAVVDQHLRGRDVSPAAHEYVAYAVQLSTLPATVREHVLAQFPGGGFTAPEEINTIVLAMDPHRFAAKAYRHFHRGEHAPAGLAAVLAMPPPPMYWE